MAFVLLAAGSCGGICFASLAVLRVGYPAWFALGHGLLGLASVVMLAVALLSVPPGLVPSRAWWAFAAVAGALVGGRIFFRVICPMRRPLWPVLMHGAAAILGLVLLFPVAFPMP